MDDTDDDTRAGLLAMATHWYGCMLSGRPELTDHNTDEKSRHRIMRVLIADAEAMTELVYGADDERPTVPVRPAVVTDDSEA